MRMHLQTVPKIRPIFKRVILWGLLLYTAQSYALFDLVYDPYDVLQNTITAKNSVQALINQAKQLQYDMENLKKLSRGRFEDTSQFLAHLARMSAKGNALSYSALDMDRRFDQLFPGLSPFADYHHAFAQWSNTAHDTLRQALSALSYHNFDFKQEDKTIEALQTESEGVKGNLQAEQTLHRIGLQQISQLQKLRQLLLTEASSNKTVMAYQLQKEQASQSALHDWVQQSQQGVKRYDGHHGFGSNELPFLP